MSERDPRRMSTAQVQIVADTWVKARIVELAGFLAVVMVYAMARLAHKWWGIEITEIVALAAWFAAKLTAKSPERTTEIGLMSMPPQRVQRIYERVMSRRPPPTPRAPQFTPMDGTTIDPPPLKRQPHHYRKPE